MEKPDAIRRRAKKAPLMVLFADLKWTELSERKGMLFAMLSGDPTKGSTHANAQGARRNGQPASLS